MFNIIVLAYTLNSIAHCAKSIAYASSCNQQVQNQVINDAGKLTCAAFTLLPAACARRTDMPF